MVALAAARAGIKSKVTLFFKKIISYYGSRNLVADLSDGWRKRCIT